MPTIAGLLHLVGRSRQPEVCANQRPRGGQRLAPTEGATFRDVFLMAPSGASLRFVETIFACGARRCPSDAHISTNAPTPIPECAGCGRCCHQVVGLVDGVDVVPEVMVVEHDGQLCMDQRGDGACVALDPVTKLCTIYEQRPNVCREFGRGGELCVNVLERAARRELGRASRV